MNSEVKIIRDLFLSTVLNKNTAELVLIFIKSKTVKKIYIKIFKLKIN